MADDLRFDLLNPKIADSPWEFRQMCYFSRVIRDTLILVTLAVAFAIAGCDSSTTSKNGTDEGLADRTVQVANNEASFVDSAISSGEQEILDGFQQADALVLEKRRHFDLSSPVAALLSLRSAMALQDPEAYEKIVWSKFTRGQISNILANNPLESLRQVSLERVPDWPQDPATGFLHPLYVAHGEEKAVAVFIFDGTSWRFLDIVGGGREWPEWRQQAERKVKG